MWSRVRDWAFGAVHVNVHIFLYVIPHAIYAAAVDVPLRLLSGQAVFGDNLQLTVITDPQRLETADFFGIPRSACTNTTDLNADASPGAANAALEGSSTPVAAAAAASSSQPFTYDGPCYNAHIHTVLSAFRPAPSTLTATREIVHSYDNCRVCLDWLFPDIATAREEGATSYNVQTSMTTAPSSSSSSVAANEEKSKTQGRASQGNGTPKEAPLATAHVESRSAPSAVVVILPGLTGSWSSIYVRRLAYFISRENMAAVVLTARGCGDTPLDQPRIFSAVHTDDLRHVLAHELNAAGLKRRFVRAPRAHGQDDATTHGSSSSSMFGSKSSSAIPVIAIGFSLGGVILSNYVGEQGKRNLPSGLAAAYAITSPHNLCAADRSMSRTLQSYTYGRELASDLRSYVTRHAHVVQHLSGVPNAQSLFAQFTNKLCPSTPSMAQATATATGASESEVRSEKEKETSSEAASVCSSLSSVSSVRDYDNLITAPHFGFDNADAYYEAADNFATLSHSHTPQLCLVAADDPICGAPEPHSRWVDLTREHKGGLIYVELPTGGHLGFLSYPLDEIRGKPNPVERLVITSLRAVVKHSHT